MEKIKNALKYFYTLQRRYMAAVVKIGKLQAENKRLRDMLNNCCEVTVE